MKMSMGCVTSQETKLIHCCEMRNRFLKMKIQFHVKILMSKPIAISNQFISAFNGSIIELKWKEPTIKANHHSQPDVLNSREISVIFMYKCRISYNEIFVAGKCHGFI